MKIVQSRKLCLTQIFEKCGWSRNLTNVGNEGYSCHVMYHLSKRVHRLENRSFWLEILYYATLQNQHALQFIEAPVLQLNQQWSTGRWLTISQDRSRHCIHSKVPRGDRWQDNRTGKKQHRPITNIVVAEEIGRGNEISLNNKNRLSLLAPIAPLAIKYILNTSWKVKCHNQLRLCAAWRLTIFKLGLVI